VGQRPSSELIQSLRVTLQKLEENFASPEDHPPMAELKRILLLRIADLDPIADLDLIEAAIEMANAENVENPEAVPQDTRRKDTVLPLIAEEGPEAV
jgi:hypothetical protein